MVKKLYIRNYVFFCSFLIFYTYLLLESGEDMDKIDIIKSITERTGGDLYLGVVGAVRTGKSTFIKKFIENLVVPNIEDE